MCYSIWNLVNKIYVVCKIPCGLFTWHVSPKVDRSPWKRDVNWTYIRRTKDVQDVLCTFNLRPVFRGRCLSHFDFLIVFSLYSLWISIASFFLGAQKLQFLADVIHKRSPVWMNFCDLFIFEIYFWVIDLGLILLFFVDFS